MFDVWNRMWILVVQLAKFRPNASVRPCLTRTTSTQPLITNLFSETSCLLIFQLRNPPTSIDIPSLLRKPRQRYGINFCLIEVEGKIDNIEQRDTIMIVAVGITVEHQFPQTTRSEGRETEGLKVEGLLLGSLFVCSW